MPNTFTYPYAFALDQEFNIELLQQGGSFDGTILVRQCINGELMEYAYALNGPPGKVRLSVQDNEFHFSAPITIDPVHRKEIELKLYTSGANASILQQFPVLSGGNPPAVGPIYLIGTDDWRNFMTCSNTRYARNYYRLDLSVLPVQLDWKYINGLLHLIIEFDNRAVDGFCELIEVRN